MVNNISTLASPLNGLSIANVASSHSCDLNPAVPLQAVRRPLPHLVAYGSTNKYRPVNRSKASGSSAKRPTQPLYFPRATATPLTMTPTVKAMDSQRWVCRNHLFQFNGSF